LNREECVIRAPEDIPDNAKRVTVQPRGSAGPVHAYIADHDGDIEGEDGHNLHFEEGQDYIVHGEDGHRSVVRRDIFKKTYRSVGHGKFRKRGDLKLHAAVCDREARVHTMEGVQPAHPGDLIMIGTAGEVWPVPAHTARRRYRTARGAVGEMRISALEIAMMAALVAAFFYAAGAF
jgi:hypothetical protein